ncbi:spermine/spermidine synthase [Mytilinidion resinicola]|uniref:Spermine/spermidine synthase n=1 Tax=Mytilinidion resinicola TaxID=574789 RepID=A0A6A6Y372_9PEZI|nr:spermine/spermidine synthase [Mytilinidion resinicola]KAF2803271.1 spermine/spermidine synthase [Mytilinidion resinicola]
MPKTPRKPKAAKEAEKKARTVPTPVFLRNVCRAAALLILAGISSPVSQLSLSPVYGSIPSSLYHQRAITGTALLAFMAKGTLKRYFPSNISDYIAIIAYWIPVIQFFLFQYSSEMGPEYGPPITELVTYLPLLFLSVYSAGELLESIDLSRLHLTIAEMAPAVGSYVTVTTISKLFTSILPQYIGTHLTFTRLGLQMGMGSALAFVSPSRLILLAVPAIIHTMRANPHYTSERGAQLANSTLQTQNFTLLDRQESLTGYISVLEGQDSGFRVLRCDHSLLGGEWLVTTERAAQGQVVPEPIFSVFAMLEAVRLMEIGDDSLKIETKPDSQKSALVIGLGIGTAPNSLISHNINTTIVELDPVVHHFATKYFDLSKNHTAVIDDAVFYVEEKSRSNPGSFDYIIHDVFTGGAEPVMLFTVEFFEGLKKLLTEDGVVAINYAGDLSLPSTLLILSTVHAIFPACRLFRDNLPSRTSQPSEPDFINMVVFCAKNDLGKGGDAIYFREPTEDDFRGSLAKRAHLMPQAKLEIDFNYEVDKENVLKRGETAELEAHQNKGAVSHWRIMRTVLPDAVWEMW